MARTEGRSAVGSEGGLEEGEGGGGGGSGSGVGGVLMVGGW